MPRLLKNDDPCTEKKYVLYGQHQGPNLREQATEPRVKQFRFFSLACVLFLSTPRNWSTRVTIYSTSTDCLPPSSCADDAGPPCVRRRTFKNKISLVLTVPTATSSRSGLQARQETGLGRLLHHATGRFEVAFQTATDLKKKRPAGGGEANVWDREEDCGGQSAAEIVVRGRCVFLGIVHEGKVACGSRPFWLLGVCNVFAGRYVCRCNFHATRALGLCPQPHVSPRLFIHKTQVLNTKTRFREEIGR